MKKVIALLNASGIVGTLPETATEELVASGVQAITGALGARDQEIVALKKTINDMTLAAKAEKEAALKTNATALVEAALTAKKIVATQKEAYITLASASDAGYNEVKKILDGLQSFESVLPKLPKGDIEIPSKKEDQALAFKKHMDEGTMSKLTDDQVKTLYAAAHGKAPSELTLKSLTGR